MHRRERIFVDVLSFQPEENTRAMKTEYHQQSLPNAERHLEHWNSIGSIWKAATTILVIRYLFFGRPELVPASIAASSTSQFTGLMEPFVQEVQSFHGVEELSTNDYLTASIHTDGPLSRSPSTSPLPSPRLATEPPNSSLWDARYDIHAEAFSTLASTLTALQPHMEPLTLRCVLMPVMILSLVSRPNSEERSICAIYFAKLEEFMMSTSRDTNDAKNTAYSIPWEKLDAYSKAVETQRGDGTPSMKGSAPEWNWWEMLNHIDLDLSWPVTAANSHLERDSAFWAYKLIAAVANKESFNVWLEETGAVKGIRVGEILA
ncbi:uncharacterized protein N0V89_009202 [Didymosphaeria variabile]|uniref:Uncharacterized protein n=1 Tax=Didymosphaeria variabile TaxID=1932322 RepID=A0A9W9C6C3_9PLEO|nr:uncharacterized protein N0V89_009202 [Didymosphaeria variabile]KAJ4347832.1 hypothetical protein N0V89_009202 [Didymosphaeria variabile]